MRGGDYIEEMGDWIWGRGRDERVGVGECRCNLDLCASGCCYTALELIVVSEGVM